MRRWSAGLLSLVIAAACGGAGGGAGAQDAAAGAQDAPPDVSGADARPPDQTPGPIISRFTATPATLPAGGGTVSLSWEVSQAETVEIGGIGPVTGTSRQHAVSATTVLTLTARSARGTATATTAVVVGQNPSRMGTRFVAMVAPVAGESFTAPASLRLVAAGRDPNVFTNYPRDGLGGNAAKVQFFVDDAVVLEVDGAQAEYFVFKGFTSGVAAGVRRVWARAIYTDPALVLDSVPALVNVAAPPSYERTIDLQGDLTVGGAAYELGAAGGRLRVNGNGHRIVSSGTSTSIALRNVDFFDVGDRASTSTPGIDLATDAGLVVEGCTFDGSNTVRFTVGGAAPATVRRNTFRSNMRQPLGQQPDANGSGSFPAVVFRGMSTASKVFQGNNVGAGWVLFETTRSWLIGGDASSDGNVLIGPRVGIYVNRSQDIQIRRNFSHHVYYGGWSQGSNFELGGTAGLTAEHNVIVGSSWPVRGVAGELRYNLVLEAGHQWLWADHSGANVHHNVFIGGDNDVGGIYVLYDPRNVRLRNNTFDGLDGSIFGAAIKLSNGEVSMTSNLFLNMPRTPVDLDGGTLAADYNLFWNSASPAYSDGRSPAHDVSRDPLLADPAQASIELDGSLVWTRALTVGEILARYRARYAPGAGSPAHDAGDPEGGAGNDIGAIGGGAPNAADLFGR
jgi:hypothetical protein